MKKGFLIGKGFFLNKGLDFYYNAGARFLICKGFGYTAGTPIVIVGIFDNTFDDTFN
jgi:hypothetical protein